MTIKDIAKISGCGVSTVSRALNGHPDISEATRRRIEEIVREYGFVPNANAKQLKQSSGESILVMINGTANMFFPLIVERIQWQLELQGRSAVFHYIDERAGEIEVAQRIISEQKPLGVIFLGGNSEHFERAFKRIHIPCVLCTSNAAPLGYKNLSSVCVDDYKAGYQAVEYLYECGHRSLGFITGNTDGKYAGKDRLTGSVQAMNEKHLFYNEGSFVQSRFSLEDGYTAASKLLENNPKITAVFASSDIMAIGAIRAFEDSGCSVPQDISVIGFDGIPLTRFTNPRLTTFKQPVEQLAELSVELLNRQMRGTSDPSYILLDAELYKGGSVKVIEE